MESKRMKKSEENEDRLSDLPDSLIHHILSLLPSAKEAIRTGVLSKRWDNQWTHVPVLIFDSHGMSHENFLKFIDNTLILNQCSKINKFHLQYRDAYRNDPQITPKIRFATRKYVEELYLNLMGEKYMLPKFLFHNASLVKLTTGNCTYKPNGKVNWECLTTLLMASCRLPDQAIEHILSGCPLLQTLLIKRCSSFNKLVIASKSLEVLVLREVPSSFDLEILCPKLETVNLNGWLNVRTAKLLILPSSLSATIDFNHHEIASDETRMSLVKDILQQLKHVKKLTIGKWFMECLSAVHVGDQFIPVFNIKRLTLKSHNFSGIVSLLRNSPVLEKLILSVTLYDQDNQDFGENYWSDSTVFNCLASHLKNVKIIGFPKSEGKHKGMLSFVQFILKNAKVLEKMVLKLKDDGTAFPMKVSQELLSLPRCSQHAIIEFLCSK